MRNFSIKFTGLSYYEEYTALIGNDSKNRSSYNAEESALGHAPSHQTKDGTTKQQTKKCHSMSLIVITVMCNIKHDVVV